MRLSPIVLGLALLAGCSGEGEQLFVAMPDLGFDVMFVLGLNEQGRTIELAGPVVFDETRAGERAAVVSADAAELLLVGWTDEELRASTPLYDSSRVAELDVDLGAAPACVSGDLNAESASIRSAAPESTQAFRLGREGEIEPALAPANLVLDFPVDLDGCVPEAQRVFRPFADKERPVAVGSEINGATIRPEDVAFRSVVGLADGRVIAVSYHWVFLFEPGQALTADLAHARFFPGYSLEGLAVDEEVSRQRGGPWVVVSGARNFDRTLGIIIDMRVSAAGLELVRTTTTDVALDEIVIRPVDGRLVGVSGRGSVQTRTSTDAPLVTIAGIWSDTGSDARIGLTGDPSGPYAIGGPGRGGVLIGDESAAQWSPASADGFDVNTRVRTIARLEEGARAVWVGTSDGRVFEWKMSTDRWEELALSMPPAYAVCGPPKECGFYDVSATIRGIELFERAGVPRVFLSQSSCVGLIDARRDGRCAGLVTIEGRALDDLMAGVGNESSDFRAIDLANGQLVLGSQEGGVYVLDVAP